jgi:hypothetical protein
MSRKKRTMSGKMSNNFFGMEWNRCANRIATESESHFMRIADVCFGLSNIAVSNFAQLPSTLDHIQRKPRQACLFVA